MHLERAMQVAVPWGGPRDRLAAAAHCHPLQVRDKTELDNLNPKK